MESETIAYSTKSSVGILKSFIIEIVIVFVLVVGIVFVLNYFKIINLAILYSKPTVKTEVISRLSSNSSAQIVTSSGSAQTDPSLPNLGAIFKSGTLHSATTNFEFEGTILSLDANTGVDKKLGVTYGHRLVLQIGEEKQNVVLVYSKDAVKKITVLDPNKKEISFKDLKAGEKVTVKTELNYIRKYPGNYNSVVITKM